MSCTLHVRIKAVNWLVLFVCPELQPLCTVGTCLQQSNLDAVHAQKIDSESSGFKVVGRIWHIHLLCQRLLVVARMAGIEWCCGGK
jgi:hypothetical protein